MTIFPEVLEATVLNDKGQGLADILVSVGTFWSGHYYYGRVMGLTDRHGIVSLTRHQLEHGFQQAQASFPMDLKVPLEQCDPAIEISLRGGAEFRDARRGVMTNGLAGSDVKRIYDRARNEQFRTTARRVDLADGLLSKVTVELTATTVT